MRTALIFIAALGFGSRVAPAQQDEHGIPHKPKPLVTLASPDKQLVAIARTPVPATDVPDYQDADGTLLFVRGPSRGDRIISHRFFGGRFVSKMLWSPDSQFLVLCSESAGGHSPWHFHTYFWSRSDGKFRSVDYRAGPVADDVLTFSSPHSLTVKIAATLPDKTLDVDHPSDRIVDLADLRRRTPPLRPSAWP
jgi:hypothetical protein